MSSKLRYSAVLVEQTIRFNISKDVQPGTAAENGVVGA